MAKDNYVIIVQHSGRYELPIEGPLSIAYALWTEVDDFCPLCEAHPSAGHTLTCPLVQVNLGGEYPDTPRRLREVS